ncbi:MAG: hypothetical protein LBN41_04225 [Enterobacteriaceae bacterium]|jgi:hypothetical protein|nr:hypothetical protein [Enterobacteriaceae bacterium]
MRTIPLTAIPNQRLTVTINNARWELTIKQARGMMVCDVMRDDTYLIRGTRIVANAPIIPSHYLSNNGNFAILTENDELPRWEKFESNQTLVYWRDGYD